MNDTTFVITKDVKRHYDSQLESLWFEFPEGNIRMPVSELTVNTIKKKDERYILSQASGNLKVKKLYLPSGERIVSRKAAIVDNYNDIEVGDIKVGVIKRIKNFGLFIHIGKGVEGLCYIENVSNARMDDLEMFFKVGQEVTVKVIKKKSSHPYRLEFSIKAATPNPYIDKDEIISARITKILDDRSGAFVELNPLKVGIVDAIPGEFELNDQRIGQEIFVYIKGCKTELTPKGHLYEKYKCEYLENCI